jgi:hypothetical protein
MATVAPEDRIGKHSSLCQLGPRPQIMTGFFRTLLVDHFRSANNIEHSVFRERLWTNTDQTGILIEDATVWTPSRTQLRPAIIIKRNGWRSLKRTINNMAGTTPQGYDEHIKFWRGSHTLFCLAQEGAEAEILAAETYRYLLHFGPVFREYFDLMLFELMDVGAISELEESTEGYVVPITMMYGWAEGWLLKLHAPLLKKVAMSDLFPPKC